MQNCCTRDTEKTQLPFVVTKLPSGKDIPVKHIPEDVYRDVVVQDPDETLPDAMEEFATSTTMHGVIFWYRNRKSKSKWFWIGLMIAMATALLYHVGLRVGEYWRRETVTSVTQEYGMTVSFPAITICSFNRVYLWTKDPDVINATHSFNRLITPLTTATNDVPGYKRNLTNIAKYLDPDLDIKRILRTHGFKLGPYDMPNCFFDQEPCTAANFSEAFSFFGLCHTYNYRLPGRKQELPGHGNGLSVTIYIQSRMFTEEAVFGLADYGLRVQVHQQGEAPNVEDYGISIPVATKASIEVLQENFELLEEPWGHCDPTNEYLKYFSLYTISNCLEECYTDAVLERCGCYIFTQQWAAGFGRECSLEEMQDCAGSFLRSIKREFSPNTCKCTVPCARTSYRTSLSYAAFPNPPTVKYLMNVLNMSDQEAMQNFISFDIYFKEMSFTKHTQSRKIDEAALISDIGGQLGLWLGMSAITAVELVQFCARKISECRERNKSRTVYQNDNGDN